jgi:hypothetical protein
MKTIILVYEDDKDQEKVLNDFKMHDLKGLPIIVSKHADGHDMVIFQKEPEKTK